jgi:hypothetical protein
MPAHTPDITAAAARRLERILYLILVHVVFSWMRHAIPHPMQPPQPHTIHKVHIKLQTRTKLEQVEATLSAIEMTKQPQASS